MPESRKVCVILGSVTMIIAYTEIIFTFFILNTLSR